MLTKAIIFFHLTLLVSSTTGGTLLHAGGNDYVLVQVGEEEGSGGEAADAGSTVQHPGEDSVQRVLRDGTQDQQGDPHPKVINQCFTTSLHLLSRCGLWRYPGKCSFL